MNNRNGIIIYNRFLSEKALQIQLTTCDFLIFYFMKLMMRITSLYSLKTIIFHCYNIESSSNSVISMHITKRNYYVFEMYYLILSISKIS